MRSGGGIRALLQAGGGRSLYAGVWGNLAGVAPASAIFMAVYEPVKQVGAQHGPARQARRPRLPPQSAAYVCSEAAVAWPAASHQWLSARHAASPQHAPALSFDPSRSL